MSFAIPTFSVEYSATGTFPGTDATFGVEEFNVTLRDLAFGTSTFDVLLNNIGGLLVGDSTSPFPAWNTETGLYYYWRFKINDKVIGIGRALKLEAELKAGRDESTELLRITGGLLDEPLKNFYLFGYIPKAPINNMINTAINEHDTLTTLYGAGAPNTTGTAPNFNADVDCSKTRPFVHDFIRDCLTGVIDSSTQGWCGYVDSTVSATSATMYIFPQNNKLNNSSLTYATDVHMITLPRSIEQTKNWVEFVGGLSTIEPPPINAGGLDPDPGDAWTETNTLGWHQLNALTDIAIDTTIFNCLSKTPTGLCTKGGAASIRLTATNSPEAELNLVEVLGVNLPFDANARNAMSLHFEWNSTVATQKIPSVNLFVELVDTSDRVIAIGAGFFVFGDGKQWRTFARHVGFNASIKYAGGFVGDTGASTDWFARTPDAESFDWGNVKAVRFRDRADHGGLLATIWIDHLHFTQNFQPKRLLSHNPSLNKYGRRMAVYSAEQFIDLKSLFTFADTKIVAMAQPSYILDLVAAKTPDQETAAPSTGYFPGFTFPAGNMPARYGLNSFAWRTLEVHYNVKDTVTTRFKLTPATGPATTIGAALDFRFFEPRKAW